MLVLVQNQPNGVTVVTLNNPDRRNAMTEEMGRAIREQFTQLAGRDDLRAVVLTGAPPAFSAGGDLDMLEELGRKTREEGFDATATMRDFYSLFLSIRACPVPVLGAINGHAVGAGACIALATDLRLIAASCKFGLNFAQLGLHPGMGGTWLLSRAVGAQRAAELLYTGRLASGAEMASYGAALEAPEAEEVLPRTIRLAERIASSSPVVVRQLKQSLAASGTLDDALDREAAAQAVNYGTHDLEEGLAAIRARRRPRFQS